MKNQHKRKKVKIYNDTEEKEFNSIGEVAEYLKCNISTVSKVLNFHANTVKGYKAEFI
jgi:Mn-dependent DtxR family transcriptional regulator